ncbi:MAG: Franean1_4349 family RiPP [Caldilineae bacterium]|nr:Franean1_4349 family RiPP [Anaerolineae bacterium]MCB0204546.1 Franean1_4349 family RiPP [Anaerolineae bacterium]MCB0253431.1 Franean1_4349 family RiPP [Anaerolineae bacterium]MCB9155045.1 Franean1_4349 family RiPP [Caldilineae bacterium]
MSQQAVESILGKAVLEEGFRSALFSDADSALAGYELSATESAALRGMDVEALEAFAGTLDQRISKSIPIGVMAEDGLWVESAIGRQRAAGAAASQGTMGHLPEGA